MVYIFYKIPVIVTTSDQTYQIFDNISEDVLHTDIDIHDCKEILRISLNAGIVADVYTDFVRNYASKQKVIIISCVDIESALMLSKALANRGITCFVYGVDGGIGNLTMFMPILYTNDSVLDWKNVMIDFERVPVDTDKDFYDTIKVSLMKIINEMIKIYSFILEFYHHVEYKNKEKCFSRIRNMMYKICTLNQNKFANLDKFMSLITSTILGTKPLSFLYIICHYFSDEDPFELMNICGFMQYVNPKSTT